MSFRVTGPDNYYASYADLLAGGGRRASTSQEDVAAVLPGNGKQGAAPSVDRSLTTPAEGTGSTDPNAKGRNGEPLSAEDAERVRKLKKRDTEVRAHEQAHIAVGGQYAKSSASFEYTTGPDGTRYASGGEVSIDASPVKDDPAATIKKMSIIKRAALAPSQPSGQDLSVAAKAESAANEARQAMQQKAAGKLGTGAGKQSAAKGTNLNAMV